MGIMVIDKIVNDEELWIAQEEKAFKESIKCYKMILGRNNEIIYQAIGPNGTMKALEKIAKKSKKPRLIIDVITNPKTYLKSTTINPLIPYSYWTCNCQEEFVRTNFLSNCPVCGCNVSNHTNKAKYLEDLFYVPK